MARWPRVSPLTWMVGVLLAATFLRLVAWQAAPPGLRFDEMLVFDQTDRIRAGARPIYLDDLAEEPLYHYAFAAAEDLMGPQLFTLRWLSAALGLIAVASIYALGRHLFTPRVGLLAAALAAAAFWSLLYSRIGLRLIALPAIVTPAMLVMWQGLRHARRRELAAAGGLLGLSAYTYSATRLLPAVLIAWLAYLLICHRALFRRQALNVGLALLVGLIMAAPLAIHIATVPAAERRLGEVEGPLAALQRGEIRPLAESAAVTAGMFAFTGDPEWLYNIPNRPVFDLLTGALFYLGVVVCVARFRQPPYALALIWLLIGLAPAVLTWPAASNSHGILAQPPTFLSAALGVDWLLSRLSVGQRGWAPAASVALLIGVLGAHTATSINDYFNRWATQPTVRVEHQAGTAQTARYFAQHPTDKVVFSSGHVTPWNPWTETTFRVIAPQAAAHTRWFDARWSFVFPNGQTDLTLITPALDDDPAPLDGRLIEDLFPTVEPSPLATDYFSATHVVSSLQTRLITLTRSAVSWPPGTKIDRAAQLPMVFGDQFNLIGYELRRTVVPIGRNIRLTTYWRVTRPPAEPLSIFVHVLDEAGHIAAQWDGFTVAPRYLQAGDVVVQVHFIPIPPDFKPGRYDLALGVYQPRTPNLPRLPITIDGQPITDRVMLNRVDMIHEP